MKNIEDKIERVELKVYDKCPESMMDLMHDYWEFDEYYDFSNKPTKVAVSYDLSLGKLNDLIREFSNLSMYVKCGTCNEIERRSFVSQTSFRNFTNKIRKLEQGKHKCQQCQAIEDENLNKAKELRKSELRRREEMQWQEIMRLMQQAINEKRWEYLTPFENRVLKNAITFRDIKELNKYYINQGVRERKMLDSAMKILGSENLLLLTFDNWDKSKIVGYQFLPQLEDEYKFQKIYTDVESNSSVEDKSLSAEKLELILKPVKSAEVSSSSLFESKFKLEEDLILKAGTEYVCQLGKNHETNLTVIIKQSDLDKKEIKQVDLDVLPTVLKNQVIEYLRDTNQV